MVEVCQSLVGLKHAFQYLRDPLKWVNGAFQMDYRAALCYTKYHLCVITTMILVF